MVKFHVGVVAALLFAGQGMVCAAAGTAPASMPQTATAADDAHDLAALRAALKPRAGWSMEWREGTLAPYGLIPAHGIELTFPPVNQPLKFVPLSVWIMSGDYSAAPAPAPNQPGTPVAGQPRELDRWNGHRVFFFDEYDKGWPNAETTIQGALHATGGPLAASIVLDHIDGKDALRFELKNRSDKAVHVCVPPRGVPEITDGFAVYGARFMMSGGRGGAAPLSGPIATLEPGQTVHWPVDRPQLKPGTNAKLDSSYGGIDAATAKSISDAKGVDVWAGSVIAPTVRVKVDPDGEATVALWAATPLTAAEEAASLQVAAGLEQWRAQFKQRLETLTAPEKAPDITLTRDRQNLPGGAACKIAINCTFNTLRDQPITLPDDVDALALRFSAQRAGERNDVALATNAARAIWDGKAIFRELRVPGTDWIVTLAVQSNRAELREKANDIVDQAYNQLVPLAVAAPAASVGVPATAPDAARRN
jgi:hypothetical protein